LTPQDSKASIIYQFHDKLEVQAANSWPTYSTLPASFYCTGFAGAQLKRPPLQLISLYR